MKQAFYKLLWLDDRRLERNSRLFGWLNIFMGGGMILAAAALYIAISGEIDDTAIWLGDLAVRLAPDSQGIVTEPNVRAASKMLLACSKLVTPMPMWASGTLAVIGLLGMLQGIMFFRIKEILDRK